MQINSFGINPVSPGAGQQQVPDEMNSSSHHFRKGSNPYAARPKNPSQIYDQHYSPIKDSILNQLSRNKGGSRHDSISYSNIHECSPAQMNEQPGAYMAMEDNFRNYEKIHAGFVNHVPEDNDESSRRNFQDTDRISNAMLIFGEMTQPEQKKEERSNSLTAQYFQKKMVQELKKIASKPSPSEDEQKDQYSKYQGIKKVKHMVISKLSNVFSFSKQKPKEESVKSDNQLQDPTQLTCEKTVEAPSARPLMELTPQSSTPGLLSSKPRISIVKKQITEHNVATERPQDKEKYDQIEHKFHDLKKRLDMKHMTAKEDLDLNASHHLSKDILRDLEAKDSGTKEELKDVKKKSLSNPTDTTRSRYVLSPRSMPHFIVDQAVLLFCVVDSIFRPLNFAFSEDVTHEASTWAYALVMMIKITYLCDMILQFVTTYVDPFTGDEVAQLQLTVRHYIFSKRFAIDLLALYPFDQLHHCEGHPVRFIRLFGLLKLINVKPPPQLENQGMEMKLLLKLGKLFFFLLLYVHGTSCLIYYLASSSEQWQPSQYNFYNIDTYFYDASLWERYVISFYHSIMVLSGNEINPIGNNDIFFISFLYITGSLIIANIYANVTVIISNISSKNQKIQEKINGANTSMANMNLPETIQEEIRQFLMTTQYNLDNQRELDNFMLMISPSLRTKVTKHIYLDAISSNPILRGSQELIDFLLNEVTPLLFHPEDQVVCQGQSGDQLFLIAKGDCTVWVNDHTRRDVFVRQIYQGEFFGEISILRSTLRTATVKSSNYCTMACLCKRIFFDLCGIFPEILTKMNQRAVEYKDSWKRFKILLLKQISYFKDFINKEEILDEIQYHLNEEFFQEGADIFNANDPCDQIIFVVSGSIQILVENDDDEQYQIEELSQGDIIGQHLVLFDEVYPFSAKAGTDTRILSLNQQFFLEYSDVIGGLEQAVSRVEDQIDQRCLPILDIQKYLLKDTPLSALKRTVDRVKRIIKLKGRGQFSFLEEFHRINDTVKQQSVTKKKQKKMQSSKAMVGGRVGSFKQANTRKIKSNIKLNSSTNTLNKNITNSKKSTRIPELPLREKRKSILFPGTMAAHNKLRIQATRKNLFPTKPSNTNVLSSNISVTGRSRSPAHSRYGGVKEEKQTDQMIRRQSKLINQLSRRVLQISNQLTFKPTVKKTDSVSDSSLSESMSSDSNMESFNVHSQLRDSVKYMFKNATTSSEKKRTKSGEQSLQSIKSGQSTKNKDYTTIINVTKNRASQQMSQFSKSTMKNVHEGERRLDCLSSSSDEIQPSPSPQLKDILNKPNSPLINEDKLDVLSERSEKSSGEYSGDDQIEALQKTLSAPTAKVPSLSFHQKRQQFNLKDESQSPSAQEPEYTTPRLNKTKTSSKQVGNLFYEVEETKEEDNSSSQPGGDEDIPSSSKFRMKKKRTTEQSSSEERKERPCQSQCKQPSKSPRREAFVSSHLQGRKFLTLQLNGLDEDKRDTGSSLGSKMAYSRKENSKTKGQLSSRMSIHSKHSRKSKSKGAQLNSPSLIMLNLKKQKLSSKMRAHQVNECRTSLRRLESGLLSEEGSITKTKRGAHSSKHISSQFESQRKLKVEEPDSGNEADSECFQSVRILKHKKFKYEQD